MKNWKNRILSLLLAAAMTAGMTTAAAAYSQADAQTKADALATLNLYQPDTLSKSLTRLEALTLALRLVGRENEALWGEKTKHPFTDLPKSGDAVSIVGYAYETGLTNGTSATTFEPNEKADAQMFVTFLLRALGYTGSDVWSDWKNAAAKAGLKLDGVSSDSFLLGDAVVLSYAALDAKLAGGKQSLTDLLVENWMVSPLSLATVKSLSGAKVHTDSALIDILGSLYAAVADEIPTARLMANEVTNDTLSYFFGIEKLDFIEAVCAEPMMLAQAHSVGLIRVKAGVDVEAAKKEIRAKVDPRKWICVGVDEENVRVESIGNLILLVMDNGCADELVNAFKKLK